MIWERISGSDHLYLDPENGAVLSLVHDSREILQAGKTIFLLTLRSG